MKRYEGKWKSTWNELTRWRSAVKRRDGYKCKKCGQTNRRLLQVHHIKTFSKYKSLRAVLSNGITLCIKCHLSFKGREELYEKECKMLIADKNILGGILQRLYRMKEEEENEEE